MAAKRSSGWWVPASLIVSVSLGGCVSTRHPAVSEEGLPRVPASRFDAVYLAGDFDPSSFGRFSVEPCAVTFRDHWLRDQNRKRGPRDRVTTANMRQIEEDMAARCRSVFAERLETTVDGLEDGESALLSVRPAIVDLDVAAPDILTPGRERSYTTSAGSMTLVLELVEASSGAVLGRVIDRRSAADTGRVYQATSSSNMAEADRILRSWASRLVELLTKAGE